MVGIYCIENTVNHKRYIGQSVNIERRWKKHKYALNSKYHYNQHLQRAWDKYGEQKFCFSVLEICNKDALDEKEKYYIEHFDTLNFNTGYNNKSGGVDGRLTPESIAKMSKTLTGKYAGVNNPLYGTKLPQETKDKISASLKGRFGGDKHPMWGKTNLQGEDNPKALITEETALKIITMLLSSNTYDEIIEQTKASLHIIKHIRLKHTWKHLTKNIVFPDRRYRQCS